MAAKDLKAWLAKRPYLQGQRLHRQGRRTCACPGPQGGLSAAVLGLGKSKDALALAAFSENLPDGIYRLGDVPDFCGGAHAALAWLMGSYHFTRYKKPSKRAVKLVLPPGVDGEEISRIAESVFLARDLINTPANDMGPAELATPPRRWPNSMARNSASSAARRCENDYPLIAAVGRARRARRA